MRPYEGLLTAMVTPFHGDGAVNEEAAVALGRHLLANGSDGLVVGGTTGESATLTDDELVVLVELMVRELGDEGTIVAGAGSNNTHHAVELTERVVARGRRRPCSRSRRTTTSPTAAASAATSRRSPAAAGDTPVILYNIPGRCVVNMGPDLLAELAQIDGIEAVKQANSDELQPIDGLAVLAGNDDILAANLDQGGAGGICVAVAHRRQRDAAPVRRAGARARRSTRACATSTRRCS